MDDMSDRRRKLQYYRERKPSMVVSDKVQVRLPLPEVLENESCNARLFELLDETAWFALCQRLSLSTLCALSQTCRTFHRITSEDHHWMSMYTLTWPKVKFIDDEEAIAQLRERSVYCAKGQGYNIRRPPRLDSATKLVQATGGSKMKKKMRALTPQEIERNEALTREYDDAWKGQEVTEDVRAVLYRCLADPFAYAKLYTKDPIFYSAEGVASCFTRYTQGMYDLRWARSGTLPRPPPGKWKLAFMDRVFMEWQEDDEEANYAQKMLNPIRKGRPYSHGNVCVTSQLQRGSTQSGSVPSPWAAGPEKPAGFSEVSAHDKAAIAAVWAEDGIAEHASIASFSRFALHLMANGAPPDLVAGAHRAALDEISHAQLCFGVAAYYGMDVSPSAFPVPPETSTPSLTRLAAMTFAEGCVEETMSAFVAVAQLHAATSPPVVQALTTIVADELAHAALAWRTLMWAVRTGGDDVLRAALQPLDSSSCEHVREAGVVSREAGVLSRAVEMRVRRAAMEGVIVPWVRQLQLHGQVSAETPVAPPCDDIPADVFQRALEQVHFGAFGSDVLLRNGAKVCL